jgi:hypothetical protein
VTAETAPGAATAPDAAATGAEPDAAAPVAAPHDAAAPGGAPHDAAAGGAPAVPTSSAAPVQTPPLNAIALAKEVVLDRLQGLLEWLLRRLKRYRAARADWWEQ